MVSGMNGALTGFQKSQLVGLELRQKASDRRAATAEVTLNPPFPYAVESWDPGFWNVPADLTPIEKAEN